MAGKRPGPDPDGTEVRAADIRAKVTPTTKARITDARGATSESTWLRDAALERLRRVETNDTDCDCDDINS